MKRRLLTVVLIVLMLAMGAGAVLAGGAKNGTFIRLDQTGHYCEGYFLETGSGIVHEWRNNPECVPYAPYITEAAVHLVFKPADKFPEADCDDSGFIFRFRMSGHLPLSYTDLGDDEANLRDFLGQDGEQYWWVCFYEWE